MSSLIKESYSRLFPDTEFNYNTQIEYNRRLAPFNANIKLLRKELKVSMNLEWKNIDDEIKIGLIQHLLLRIFKKKGATPNIELYNNFTKNIHMLTPKTQFDPVLQASFSRINERFLGSSLELPNLKWGTDSRRKLAHYNFNTDTITVSTLFKEAPQDILDYIMYHEMLHKHFKFEHNNGRASYHSPAFRAAERMYPNWKEKERQIGLIIRKSRPTRKVARKKSLWNWFR